MSPSMPALSEGLRTTQEEEGVEEKEEGAGRGKQDQEEKRRAWREQGERERVWEGESPEPRLYFISGSGGGGLKRNSEEGTKSEFIPSDMLTFRDRVGRI